MAIVDAAVTVRNATPDDAAEIHRLIVALAEYEREPDAVEVTVSELDGQLRQPDPPFSCLLAEANGRVVGFALYFHNYSTWRGRRGVYLEDLFVESAVRGQGVGRALLSALARIAVDRGCARMEWSVLDWNEPSIRFYESLGAVPMRDWTTFRLTGDALAALADASEK